MRTAYTNELYFYIYTSNEDRMWDWRNDPTYSSTKQNKLLSNKCNQTSASSKETKKRLMGRTTYMTKD